MKRNLLYKKAKKFIPGISQLFGKRPDLYLPGNKWPIYYSKAKGVEIWSLEKKKYYDFIQNLPIFIPDTKIGNEFSELITQFPVTPYLDSRPSFNKWIHFIHNKINVITGKPEMNMLDSIQKYNEHYNKPEHTLFEISYRREKIIYIGIIITLITTAYYLSK